MSGEKKSEKNTTPVKKSGKSPEGSEKEFRCRECGSCCRWQGMVMFSDGELHSIASLLGETDSALWDRFAGLDVDVTETPIEGIGNIYTIHMKEGCVLYDDGCIVYEARPGQCRAFPFWPGLSDSKEAWDKMRGKCVGVNACKYPGGEV